MTHEPQQFSLYNGTVTGTFDPTKSRYRYKIDGQKGWPMSVSVVANMADKSPMLIPWQLKIIRQYFSDFLTALQEDSLSKPEILELIDMALAQPDKEKNEAAELGRKAHEWFLAFAQAKMNETELPELPEEQNLKNCLNGFLEWYNKHKIEFVETEQIVYSKKFGYIGCFDVLAYVDGKLTLVDYKTSRSIHSSHFAQLAGYKIAREEEKPEEKIEQIMIIHPDKENGTFREPIVVKTKKTIKELEKGFIHALQFKKIEKEANKLLR